MKRSIDEINALNETRFIEMLGGVFEHSPWVAQRTWGYRPFMSVDALHARMCRVVAEATREEQRVLIRAHPQLAGRAAIRGELTTVSANEQRGAGLDQCSPEEYARLTELNAVYEQKFDFPFIIAVRGHTRSSIIAAMVRRLEHEYETEYTEALQQIARIASLRLADMIQT